MEVPTLILVVLHNMCVSILFQQDELTTVLGQYTDMGMNFVSGAPLNDRNRVEVLIDDQGLYRETQV